jgi:septum formation protein
MRIILASKSPRRREILSSLGISFEVVSADADESSDITDPCLLVRELALRKARATRDLLRLRGEWNDDTLIIASDTVVATDEEILGKPRDGRDATRMLGLLQDGSHRVISGVALVLGEREVCGYDVTAVRFGKMSEAEIAWYVASGEPADKAGAYAVQGLASMWIKGLEGDYFNVVGLPVYRLGELLRELTGEGLAALADPRV